MQIFLIRETKGNAVHATDTRKRTGCGINLQKPENMAKYSMTGSVEDAFGLMNEVTCEKCQSVFTKRILKADRKEMNRMLKEEKKRTKTMGEDPNLVSLAEVQQERQKQAEREARSAARAARREQEEAEARAAAAAKAAEEAAAAPAVPETPVVPEVPAAPVIDHTPEPAFEQYVPPVKKPAAAPVPTGPAPTHTSFGGFALDGDLAQFALPKTAVDPTAAAFAANEGKNPNILAQQKEAEKPAAPVLDDPDDIMAQFGIPTTPAPAPAAPQVEEMDDIMAQFGISDTPAPAPAAPQAESAPLVDSLMEIGELADRMFGEDAVEPAAPVQPAMPAFTTMTSPVEEFANAVAQMGEAAPAMPEFPAFSQPVEDVIPTVVEVPAFTAPEPVEEAIPEVPAFTAPEPVEEAIPEVPQVPAFTAPEPVQTAAPAAPEMPAPQPMQNMNVQQPFMQQPMQAMPQMQNMQGMVPQFMGYDAQGQPVYTYVQQVMPQFMGYDAQGQPVYAPPVQPYPQQTAPVQPVPQAPVQPVVQAAPVQPVQQEAPAPAPQKKKPLLSPMTADNAVQEKLSLPADTERPAVEPMAYAKPKKSQGVRVSKIEQKNDMPDFVRSAVSKSAAPQGNIFDQQDAKVNVTDSIEDLLSMMGEDTSKFKKKNQADDVSLEFKEYKPKAGKPAAPKKTEAPKAEEPARPLTKEELKRQKRQEKIDAKFKKDLAKRGF